MARNITTIDFAFDTPRYYTSLKRLSQKPLRRIALGIAGVGESVADGLIRQIFGQTIGAAWNQHTLAQRGITLPANCFPYPTALVNYDPTLNNIATAVFGAMQPIITEMGNQLVFVTAQCEDVRVTRFS
ncbi:hypothetical protein [Marininema halotolerans]|uniref:Uncharacterized protein n=1 Tax=Marininema halotolerans TaxID=1155944 RepID=A0A1I6P3M6_9BACL|nr:hypothetical protein [Marininema halotolerans]SFS34775.1 hypothetical protein SAMN05444972_101338 [Marininema halotolerans]